MNENYHVKEHCSVFALSDKTASEYRQQCDHDHDKRCAKCKGIVSTLKDTEQLLSRASYSSDDDHDKALYFAQQSMPYINESATS